MVDGLQPLEPPSLVEPWPGLIASSKSLCFLTIDEPFDESWRQDGLFLRACGVSFLWWHMFLWFEAHQCFEPSFQQEMTKRCPSWSHVWKGHPKMVKRKLDGKTRPKGQIEPEVWTFPTPFMLPFWLPFCVGGTTASKSSKRVVPAHVEQNDVSTSSGKTYCRSLFTGFPLLCSCSKVHCPQDGTFCAGSFPPDPQCSGI